MKARTTFLIDHDGSTMRAIVSTGQLWLTDADILWCKLKDIRDDHPSLDRTMIDVVWDPKP